jgi:hypothetical protein
MGSPRHLPAPESLVSTGYGRSAASWRERQLLRAGFDTDLAASVAADCAMDLHALIELVERGCPPTLAARILAPLDHERKAC